MADENKTPGIGSNSAIIVALLATGAIWFSRPAPLETARPAPIDKHVEVRFEDQDVEARLWQDPLEAIARESEKADAGQRKECEGKAEEAMRKSHCRSPLFDARGERVKGSEKTLALGVVAPGAPYFEDSETRRRLRYAALSGLLSERFTPNDDQHIGYFRPADYKQKGLPAAIPYETFQKEGGDESILLLWIDEDIFKGAGAKGGGAIRRLVALKDALCPPDRCAAPLKFSILGPYTSDARKNLADGSHFICRETEKKKRLPMQPVAFDFYSFAVTGAPMQVRDTPACEGRLQSQEVRIASFSTIADDKTVAERLVEELKRRGLGAKSDERLAGQILPHVALVSDADTEYGRNVAMDFEKALNSLSCAKNDSGSGEICAQIGSRRHSLTYLRGLDGMQPAKDDKDKKDKDQKGAPAPATPMENAFGPGQFDYLRRLADGLKAEDDRLWRESHTRIGAIGILGNDVFDKLLALRALRPLFPQAAFFTSDFDQALASPNELDWSRNLLIASGYGPSLSRIWQGRVPPFRGAYQTSAFLATRLAADEFVRGKADNRGPIEEAAKEVQLFEIDRNGGFLALPQPDSPDAKTDARIRVQPSPGPIFSELADSAANGWFFLFLLAGLSTVYLAYKNLLWPYLKTTWMGLALCLFAAAGVALRWQDLAMWATDGGLGEPLAAMQGISAWPTVAIRTVGVVIALCLTIDAWFCLRRNLDRTVKKETLYLPDYSRPGGPIPAPFYDVTPEWEKYVRRSSFGSVARRVAVGVLLAFAVFACLSQIFGWPGAPWRGAHLEVYRRVTVGLVFLMLVLTFLVVDATMLCLRFVVFLRDHRTRWMPATRSEYSRILGIGLNDPLLDDWIDLSFIAARTSCIGNLIYMPFGLSVLLIVSRSTIFTNFAPSVAILLTQGLCIAVLFACAMALCFSAEQARELAKRRLSQEILTRKAPGAPAGGADPLEEIKKRVEGLREGSFVPLSQQPPIRALLLPLGGLGWTALLDYRLFPGL
ncbi:hypothetical protein [Methylocystis parvus]|uniref:Uncharacterized protein n=1 Tax=Methylocystis parvus TaxID=134 RepID=A0A6B8M500_9HYPH|nr:hypothetical protein [Methylocystis parvus]QGM99044.1 hypothetical protein F7D14_17175 [Methylocystis parvus]WBK00589.1 hypothetical protein MMG94_02365 [Methylocystis parvus OBBP]